MAQLEGSSGPETKSRRDFLKTSVGLPAALSGLTVASSAYAAGSDVIRIGIVGCGTRAPEAATQQMDADKGVRLVAMADMRRDRIEERRLQIKQKYPDQVAVDDDHCFTGFDAYKHVIEASDVVLIANAAKFHPLHLMAAVEARKHVFVEKPHAIDPAGLKVIKAAAALAKENKTCLLSGLQSRYSPGYRETVQRVHDGAIGEIVSIEENFIRGPYNIYQRLPGASELDWQASAQMHFHWLSGDDVNQSLVHNLDRSSWILRDQMHATKCHGLGGRATLKEPIYGNVFDHHSVVYEFANGLKIYAFCRTIDGCYNNSSSLIYGTKGRCNLTASRIEGETKWQYQRPKDVKGPIWPHAIEQFELIKAIRAGNIINSGDYMALGNTMTVMGQISCYTGKEVTWDQVVESDFSFGPPPEQVRAGMEPPVKPNPDGTYPVVSIPGVTKML